MPIETLMPALSPTMEEGNLAKWIKKEGDKVVPGDVIAEIETDKATMEVEAVDEGTLGKILVAEGTQGVKVNTPIAVLLQEGEDADSISSTTTDSSPMKKESEESQLNQESSEPAPQDEKATEVRAAPGCELAADPDIPAGT